MGWFDKLRDRMDVQNSDGQAGVVSQRNDRYYLNGREIDERFIDRIENDRLYLTSEGYQFYGMTRLGQTAPIATSEETRIPIHEERLTASVRPVESGAVEIQKRVVEESQTVPVETSYERANVERNQLDDRLIIGDELAQAFQEGVIRILLRGEQVIAEKEIVQSGEVVVQKQRITERQQVTDTVRKEVVEVEEHYNEALPYFRQRHDQRKAGRQFDEAEPNYRLGYAAARDPRFQGQRFEDVEPQLRLQWARQNRSERSWEELRDEVREGFSYGSRGATV